MRPSRSGPLSAALLGLAIAGCWPFSGSSGSSNPDASKPANDPNARGPRGELAARIEAVEAAKYPLEETLELSAYFAKRVDANHIGSPRSSAEIWARMDSVHEGALAAHPEPEAQFELYRAWATTYAVAQDPKDDQLLMKALAIKSDPVLYVQIARGKVYSYRASRVAVCNAVRPQVEGREDVSFTEFLDKCLEWADDDMDELWPGASKDYAKLAKLKKEEAKEDARDKAFHDVVAVIFPAGGPCVANACDSVGWKSYWDGEIASRCVNDDCYGIGWQSSTPYGVVNTRCVKEDCLTYGWKSVGPKGTWVATCNKGDCQLGWVVKKGGERWAVVREDGGESGYGPYVVTSPKGKYKCTYRHMDKAAIECEETQ